MGCDPRTFSELVGRGVPTPEIIEARRRYYEALNPETCEPIEVCVATRVLQNAHARAGWTGWQSYFEFLNFLELTSAAGRSYAARTGAPMSTISAAVLDGLGVHVHFVTPIGEPIVPFTTINAAADAYARARFEELPRTADPASFLPASLEMLLTHTEHESEGRLARVRNAIKSFLQLH